MKFELHSAAWFTCLLLCAHINVGKVVRIARGREIKKGKRKKRGSQIQIAYSRIRFFFSLSIRLDDGTVLALILSPLSVGPEQQRKQTRKIPNGNHHLSSFFLPLPPAQTQRRKKKKPFPQLFPSL